MFVTAHTKYAADAFSLDAIDYIVKPITKEALAKALTKIQKFMKLNNPPDSSVAAGQITIKNDHELYFINPGDIYFIEKEIRKTVLHTVNGRYLTSESLKFVLGLLFAEENQL